MVPGLGSHNISSICAGNELSAAVSATGDLFVWGAVRVSFFYPSSHYERAGGYFLLGQQRTGHPTKWPTLLPSAHQTLHRSNF